MWLGGWCWDNYIRHFEARGHKCIAPTLRYHDKAPANPPHPRLGTTSVRDYVNDLAQEAAHLDSPPIIMGHSMGGLLAQMLASRVPAKALVLLTPAWPHGTMVADPRVVRAFWSIAKTPGFWKKAHLPAFEDFNRFVFNATPSGERRALYDRCTHESGRAAAEIGLWYLDRDKASTVDASKITCPVLVIAGSKDRIMLPYITRKIAARYHATYREFPDNAHWVLGEPGWERIAEEISAWIGGLEGNNR